MNIRSKINLAGNDVGIFESLNIEAKPAFLTMAL